MGYRLYKLDENDDLVGKEGMAIVCITAKLLVAPLIWFWEANREYGELPHPPSRVFTHPKWSKQEKRDQGSFVFRGIAIVKTSGEGDRTIWKGKYGILRD
jgi:hypothetical protein